jgi:tetratricopeptide (TPR) repeat protein
MSTGLSRYALVWILALESFISTADKYKPVSIQNRDGKFHFVPSDHDSQRTKIFISRLRGGSTNREEMEARIKQERAAEADKFQKAKEAQEKKKLEREQLAMRQLAIKEEEDARNQLIQKRKRKLPDILTLENLSRYARDLLQDREYDEAVEAYRRVLLVDPYDLGALYDLGFIMQGIPSLSRTPYFIAHQPPVVCVVVSGAAHFLEHKQDLVEAEEYYTKALEVPNPRHRDSIFLCSRTAICPLSVAQAH